MTTDNQVLSQKDLMLTRLIHNLDKSEFAILNRDLQKLSLSNIQALVIIYLTNNENRETFQKNLEIEFGVTNPTMTVSLKSMISKGLIIKTKSISDGRYYSLHLTSVGKEMYEKCMSVYNNIEKINKSILNDKEEQEYRRLTQKLIHGLAQKEK